MLPWLAVDLDQGVALLASKENKSPTNGNVRKLLGIQTGQENLSVRPGDFFHRTVRIVRPFARSGTKPVGATVHHRLVPGLGHLDFTQVKALGQGDILFRFIRPTPRFGGRTAHREGGRGCQFVYWAAVDRHAREGLAMTMLKESAVRIVRASGSLRAYAIAMTSKGKLLLLKTDTKTDIVVAVTGDKEVSSCRTQIRAIVVPGATSSNPM